MLPKTLSTTTSKPDLTKLLGNIMGYKPYQETGADLFTEIINLPFFILVRTYSVVYQTKKYFFGLSCTRRATEGLIKKRAPA